MTKAGLQLLTQLEGFKGMPYRDSGGRLTIGIGTLLPITKAEALLLVAARLKPAEDAIATLVKVPLSANQRDALASFVYNIGIQAFANSTLLKVLNRGTYDQVPAQMQRWVHDEGKVEKGLVNRRAAEIALWNRP